jgi:hypothetical protein
MKLTIRYTTGDPPREWVEEIQAVSIAYDGSICRIEAVMPEAMVWRIHGSSDATLWQRIKRRFFGPIRPVLPWPPPPPIGGYQPTKRMTGPNVAPPPDYGKPPCTPHGQGTK